MVLRRLGCFAICLAVLAGALSVASSSAQAAAQPPCTVDVQKRVRYNNTDWPVYWCKLWRGNVPVYSSPSRTTNVVGYLRYGGWSNWFWCQHRATNFGERGNYYLGSLAHNVWAMTKADNGRIGWVSEVFFSGGANYQERAWLPMYPQSTPCHNTNYPRS